MKWAVSTLVVLLLVGTATALVNPATGEEIPARYADDYGSTPVMRTTMMRTVATQSTLSPLAYAERYARPLPGKKWTLDSTDELRHQGDITVYAYTSTSTNKRSGIRALVIANDDKPVAVLVEDGNGRWTVR